MADIKLTKSLDVEGGEPMTHMQAIAKAFLESCDSIAADSSLDEAGKEEQFGKSLFELNDYVTSRQLVNADFITKAMTGDRTDDSDPVEEDETEENEENDLDDDEDDFPDDEGSDVTKNKCKLKKGNEDMQEIDVTKMTPEDKKTLETLANKYSENPGDAIHPDVRKALDEVEELKKELEIQKLTDIAKKYEVIGKKANETAEKLYDLKKAGGTAYDDYVAIMDEMVDQQNRSGIFKSIGSDKGAGGKQSLESAVAEIKKANPTVSYTDAVEQAYRDNPDLPETF